MDIKKYIEKNKESFIREMFAVVCPIANALSECGFIL